MRAQPLQDGAHCAVLYATSVATWAVVSVVMKNLLATSGTLALPLCLHTTNNGAPLGLNMGLAAGKGLSCLRQRHGWRDEFLSIV